MEKKDRRVIKSKKLIEDSIVYLLSEQSFSEMTVKEISETAGISRNTFYMYYPDKYSFTDELLNYLEQLCQDFCEAGEAQRWELLLLGLEEKSSLLNFLIRSREDETIQKSIRNLLLESIYYVLTPLELTSKDRFVCIGMAEGIYGLIEHWLMDEPHGDEEREEVTDAIRRMQESVWRECG